MLDLGKTRDRIDEVDEKIVALFEERMKLTNEVAEYKQSTGKPVFDKQREDEKLDKVASFTHTEFNQQGARDLFSQIMSISRRYQYETLGDENFIQDFQAYDELPLTKDSKVVYQGVEGAYSEIATMQFFHDEVSRYHVATFKDVMKELESGRAEYGVLPIENSSAGTVDGIYDLLAKYQLTIVGEEVVHINQALLALPGTDLSQIKTVFSHPQGLMQSIDYLDTKEWKQVSVANTAVAAKKIRDDNDCSQAAIASERAAKLYGLEVLNPKLNSNDMNATRFIILSPKRMFCKKADKISITLGLAHESGALYKILAYFICNHLNMTKIESRPLPGKQWEYSFFIEFTGQLYDKAVINALKGIKEESIEMRILGNF